ncbi:hypothetical protein F511_30711 [Dorcoceras hygrometricum]|uniref:Uncharacterized protein n=1 Tax=Dorcoceras hygrometricum TaxID=472368 RepID=A0A2Z7B7T2_9LAMI|nr:hypothetical protein F511_30711 [Dorcoceras hygrometricum]
MDQLRRRRSKIESKSRTEQVSVEDQIRGSAQRTISEEEHRRSGQSWSSKEDRTRTEQARTKLHFVRAERVSELRQS